MSPGLIERILRELNGRLAGGVISRVHQPDERDIVLKVFIHGGHEFVLISTHPRFARLHATRMEFTNPPAPKRFCAFLRSRIEGARIEAFSQVDKERICLLTLKKRNGNAFAGMTLRAELTGKSSNIILLDDTGVVMDALKYYRPEDSVRPVMPGMALASLPTAPEMHEGIISKEEAGTWNEAADKHYAALLRGDGAAARRAALRRALHNAEARASRKLKNLRGDEERAIGFVDSARLGGLLLANFKKLKRGMKEVEAADYTVDPPAAVTIPLDEKIGPKENVERLFKRARKAKAALEVLRERMPQTERDIEYIRGLLYELESAGTDEDADAVEEEIMEAGYVKRVKAEPKKPEPPAEPIRRSTSSEGFELLCGKTSAGNDLIVRKYAKTGDVWLHAKDCPGSHVLVKAAGREKDITIKTIEEAARVAASHSKAGGAGRVEVIYTDARHVKKPKGAPPGLVTVSEYKTVVVRREE
ncbi:MAG: NFACT family protein [Deltaproteobacteria bacterium]|nr:NFACT family protein [Deltaproteobacteria bacterium]